MNTSFDLNHLRQRFAGAGFGGALLFCCTLAVGQVLHIPGMLFVVVAALVYGPVMGLFVAFVGALIAVSTTFVLVRGIGQGALAELDRPLVNRLLVLLAAHPIRTGSHTADFLDGAAGQLRSRNDVSEISSAPRWFRSWFATPDHRSCSFC
ncbi:MAG: hypothetical protein R3C68_13890 [Myxococcota bacterium]